jgi:hypothetical protein
MTGENWWLSKWKIDILALKLLQSSDNVLVSNNLITKLLH